MTDEFDLVAFAAKTRLGPAKPGPNDVLTFSDMETSYFIGQRSGNWVLEESRRNTQRFVLGSFETELDAKRFFVQEIGSSWRSFRLPEIRYDSPAAGFVLDEGPTAWVLTGHGRMAEFPATVTGQWDAIEFSHIADLSLGAIAALY